MAPLRGHMIGRPAKIWPANWHRCGDSSSDGNAITTGGKRSAEGDRRAACSSHPRHPDDRLIRLRHDANGSRHIDVVDGVTDSSRHEIEGERHPGLVNRGPRLTRNPGSLHFDIAEAIPGYALAAPA